MSIRSCVTCKKAFHARPSHIRNGWGKFCSIKCKGKSQINQTKVICATCGKIITRPPSKIERRSKSKKFFCNKSCFAIWKNKTMFVGPGHPQWTDGHASYRRMMLRRASQPLACAHCGFNDIRALLVHHVDHSRKNNATKNLLWLCHNCHYLIHEGRTI